MKVVINQRWGGFSLSDKALDRLRELGASITERRSSERANPLLVQVVEELGEAANGCLAKLKVVEIPDGIEWEIHDYDGMEHVMGRHRT